MMYAFDDYLLDTSLFELSWRGERRLLQPKPLDVLMLLVENRERVVTKAELRERLWPGVIVSDNALVQAVACTRDGLRDARSPAIENVRGRGYRFTLDVAPIVDVANDDASPVCVARVACRCADRRRRRRRRRLMQRRRADWSAHFGSFATL
jgi:DNA-binding winged helix-turn-helix (wHTH) protein